MSKNRKRALTKRWMMSCTLGLAPVLTLGIGSLAVSTPAHASTPRSQFENYLAKLAPPNFTAPKKHYKIIFLDASTIVPQQKSIEIGAQNAAKRYGVNFKVLDAGGFQNLNEQVTQFQTALGDHPNAIMILPASPVAFNSELADARKAGIKVLPLLIPPPNNDFNFALADNLPLDAEKAVDSLATSLHGKGQIFAMIGGAGSTVAEAFTAGMTSELKKYPGIKVVLTKTFPGYSVSDAATAAQEGYAAHRDVAGVITNDTILGLGAAQGLAVDGKHNLPIAGIGPGSLADVKALATGQITVGSGPPFYAVGYATVQWATYILDGHTPAQKVVTVPPLVLTKSNIKAAISSGELYQVLAPSTLGCGPGESKAC